MKLPWENRPIELNPQAPYDLTLGNVSVTDYADAASGDKLSFSYQQVALTTTAVTSDGSPGSSQTFSWDLALNRADASIPAPVPSTASDQITLTGTVLVLPGSADLQVTITDGVTSVVPGTVDTYTITVSNNGPDTVSSVTLIDAIPAALSNASFAPSVGAYDVASGVWGGLSLASGQSVSMTLSSVIDPHATGTISNTVTVFAPAGVTETHLVNNVATDTDTLTFFSVNPSPPPGTSANMILRRVDGTYIIYDIGNNAILAAHPLGQQVGTGWQDVGVGGFNGSLTSLILRMRA